MLECEFAEKIAAAGGRAYIAGGWVRDKVRGAAAKDKDYVVCGLAETAFARIFPRAAKVGRSFPVYLLEIDGDKCEVAFARREKKSGRGYRGFTVFFDPLVTIEEDLYRRDTTMNSMAWEILDRRFIDPYGGTDDIRRRRIRATSEHFREDPVRALRAARQAAELGFVIEESTIELMCACGEELALEPQERLFQELLRALACPQPSRFFRALQVSSLLATAFPELGALIGQRQPPQFHPEGDAFEHTMQVVDAVAAVDTSLVVRFAALVHDIGKGTTAATTLPHHYGHERSGMEVLAAWNRRMTLPRQWLKAAFFVIREHMRAPRLTRAGKIVDLLLAAAKTPLGVEGFAAVIQADHGSLPLYLERQAQNLQAIRSVQAAERPMQIQGRDISQWLKARQIEAYLAAAGN